MAALARRRTRVAPFKVGPDYIDPGYHTLAAGAPGRNLDPVMVGPERVAPLARHGAAGADVAVVEGVMGLFDGRLGTAGAGSTAEVAALLGAPVVLVVDVRGQSRSLAAVLHGFRSFSPDVDVAGVILNRVGGERHAEALREAADEVGLPVLGALPRRAELVVPSRHLGLVTAAEHGAAAHAAVDAMADLVAEHVDLDAVTALARSLPGGPAWDPAAEIAAEIAAAHERGAGAPRPVVAVAGGPAFGFGYAEHAELLTAAGADVARVDPLRDASLPDRTAALVLPGGFPEEHVAALADNASLRAEVAALAASGAPVHAECGGLLYLCRALDGVPMCGVLDADAEMTGRLTLGYRDAVALTDSAPFPAGRRVTG
ncbi:MAG: cobyrinate a,c-diamide synthase, partial [Actinomycetota bacterium]|nr:cobyrinate a,c-diamide synthase [Actinomycetota bacterium]